MCNVKQGMELNKVYREYYSGKYVEPKDYPSLMTLTVLNRIEIIRKNGRIYAFAPRVC